MKKKTKERLFFAFVFLPVWFGTGMLVFNAMLETYGKDSPAMIVAALVIAMLGFSFGWVANKFMVGFKE
jgi:hypothetical protein